MRMPDYQDDQMIRHCSDISQRFSINGSMLDEGGRSFYFYLLFLFVYTNVIKMVRL